MGILNFLRRTSKRIYILLGTAAVISVIVGVVWFLSPMVASGSLLLSTSNAFTYLTFRFGRKAFFALTLTGEIINYFKKESYTPQNYENATKKASRVENSGDLPNKAERKELKRKYKKYKKNVKDRYDEYIKSFTEKEKMKKSDIKVHLLSKISFFKKKKPAKQLLDEAIFDAISMLGEINSNLDEKKFIQREKPYLDEKKEHADRLQKIRVLTKTDALMLNTIEIYVPIGVYEKYEKKMEKKELSKGSVFYGITKDIKSIEDGKMSSILIYGGTQKTMRNAAHVMAKALDEDSIVLKIPINKTGKLQNVLKNQGNYFNRLQTIIESHNDSGYKIVLYFENISSQKYKTRDFMENFRELILKKYVWNDVYDSAILFIATANEMPENDPVFELFKNVRGSDDDDYDDVYDKNRIRYLGGLDPELYNVLPIRRPAELEGEDFNPFDF